LFNNKFLTQKHRQFVP